MQTRQPDLGWGYETNLQRSVIFHVLFTFSEPSNHEQVIIEFDSTWQTSLQITCGVDTFQQ